MTVWTVLGPPMSMTSFAAFLSRTKASLSSLMMVLPVRYHQRPMSIDRSAATHVANPAPNTPIPNP